MKDGTLTFAAVVALLLAAAAQLVNWIDPPQPEILIEATPAAAELAPGPNDFNLPFVIGAELCPVAPDEPQEERVNRT